MEKIEKKVYRILILSFLFFISGILFFGWRVQSPATTPLSAMSEVEILNNSPQPETFKSFSYTSSKDALLKVNGYCRDHFSVILIFNKGIDYRRAPEAARYNIARPCPLVKFFYERINLSDYNFSLGDYYIIKADQGATGSWYNPN